MQRHVDLTGVVGGGETGLGTDSGCGLDTGFLSASGGFGTSGTTSCATAEEVRELTLLLGLVDLTGQFDFCGVAWDVLVSCLEDWLGRNVPPAPSMKTAIMRAGSIGPLPVVRPRAEALLVPSSFWRMMAVSDWAPQPAEGQSRGVPSTTVRPGMVTPAVVSMEGSRGELGNLPLAPWTSVITPWPATLVMAKAARRIVDVYCIFD